MLSQSALSINIVSGINKSMEGVFRSLEKLSSGVRINRASDDPAGLVISEQMRSRIASLNQAIRNTSNNSHKYSTADSAVLELRRTLSEMRNYAVEASGAGFADDNVTQAWQSAVDGLVESYNLTIDHAAYGSQKLLDGSAGAVADIEKIENIDVSTEEAAQSTVEALDEKIAELDTHLAEIGSRQSQEFESQERSMRIELENLTAAESAIRDTDYAVEFSNLIKNRLALQSSVTLLAHSFVTNQAVLSLITKD